MRYKNLSYIWKGKEKAENKIKSTNEYFLNSTKNFRKVQSSTSEREFFKGSKEARYFIIHNRQRIRIQNEGSSGHQRAGFTELEKRETRLAEAICRG